ncbi:MAG: SMP-30/gluconolactonase/LRE family protein [Armatimonadetes bacterium]|nr:SMP-30/gluconolactonase/LRE family protein [Armatimonadota bacterium]
MPLVSDDRGLGALVASTEAEKIASGLTFTEGPVWHPDGCLLFSDIPNNRIHKWTAADGAQVWREPSGNSNGLTLDHKAHLIACEHGNRRVSRTADDGAVTAIAERYEGKRLNSPNDVVVHSSGAIYFTDPPYGVQQNQRELDFQGVYRIAEDGGLTLLVDDFLKPNGLAFSPDEQRLYVDDTDRHHIRVFDVQADGTLTGGRLFADMNVRADGGADGMKVDADGRVYCTGPGGCWCFAADGTHLGTLVLPEVPANVAWGDDDRSTLYFTARTSVYRLRMRVRGSA